MRVLLISPLDPDIPKDLKFLMGGENTYTRMLLKYPPKGVEFIHLDEAIKKGLIQYESVQQNFFLWLQKFRVLPLGPRVQVLKMSHDFDLVYAHAYPVKIIGKNIPLVTSDSSSNLVFLEKYLKWPKWRILFSQSLKLLLFRLFQIVDPEVNPTKHLFVFSKWAKKVKSLKFKVESIKVIYPGLPVYKETSRLAFARSKSKSIKLLFVGVWFERKGGRILLEAFRRLSNRYSELHLIILGPLPSDVVIKKSEHIVQKDFVPYTELLNCYRTHDILVHVPPHIEGYGMTVPEAMGFGMVPVVSNVCVLPEFVEHKKSGLVIKSGSVQSLEKALEILISNKALRLRLSNGAYKQFINNFSLSIFHKKLLRFFDQAFK